MDANTAPAPRRRFYLLDGLRLCAALGVVFYHYTAFNAHDAWGKPSAEKFPGLSNLTAFGALGVQLFFIISGFVIVLSAQNRTVHQFAASRISRLFPAYWVAVIAAAALYLVIAPVDFKDAQYSDVFANIVMMQDGVGAVRLDGVYWTLWVELLFYIMIGVLVQIGLTEGRIMAMAFLWPVVSAIAKTQDADLLNAFLQGSYSPFFAGGMVLFLIHRHGHSMMRWLLLGFDVCMGVYQANSGWLGHNIPEDTGVDISQGVGMLIVLCLFGLVALVTVTPLKYKGWTWLTGAGALTYPLYLIHEAWGWFVIDRLHDAVENKWVLLGGTVGCMLVAAWLINRLVEKPIGPRLNAALKRDDPARRASDRRGAHAR